MNRLFFVFIALVFTQLFSCEYENEDDLFPMRANCNLDNISYTLSIEPIINKSCAVPTCHVSGGDAPIIFNSYQAVKSTVESGNFKSYVIDLKIMPKNSTLTKCELNKIKIWLAADAPNN